MNKRARGILNRTLNPQGLKSCGTCDQIKSLDLFGSNRGRYDGKSEICKPCRNPKVRVKKFGITEKDLHRMMQQQMERCAICGVHSNLVHDGLAIDHCHESNKVRGLLCANCNRGLGLFKDNIYHLQKAIFYLEKNK